METGKVEANLGNLNREFNLPYIPDLIALKAAGTEKEKIKEINLEFHHQEYARLRERLVLAADNSHLPDAPNAKDALNDLLIRVRLNKS